MVPPAGGLLPTQDPHDYYPANVVVITEGSAATSSVADYLIEYDIELASAVLETGTTSGSVSPFSYVATAFPTAGGSPGTVGFPPGLANGTAISGATVNSAPLYGSTTLVSVTTQNVNSTHGNYTLNFPSSTISPGWHLSFFGGTTVGETAGNFDLVPTVMTNCKILQGDYLGPPGILVAHTNWGNGCINGTIGQVYNNQASTTSAISLNAGAGDNYSCVVVLTPGATSAAFTINVVCATASNLGMLDIVATPFALPTIGGTGFNKTLDADGNPVDAVIVRGRLVPIDEQAKSARLDVARKAKEPDSELDTKEKVLEQRNDSVSRSAAPVTKQARLAIDERDYVDVRVPARPTRAKPPG
jgi:hypothetical protein